MFLALREINHSRLRYLLITAILAMLAWLVFLLSGLANGLSNDNASSLINLKADYVVYQADSRFMIHRSVLPMALVDQIKQIPGVQGASAIGQLTITATRLDSTKQIDATILAIDPRSFVMPEVSAGKSFAGQPSGSAVVDEHFKTEGVKVGDQLKLEAYNQTLTIVGFTKNQNYGHLPVIFTDILFWQSLKFAIQGSSGQVVNPANIIAVQMNEATSLQVAKNITGIEVATRQQALEGLPGYKEEFGSVIMILVFLFIIAAFILAAFFYTLTLQKNNQFGILKVLGATNRFLAKDLIGQVIILTLVGIIIGVLLSYGVVAIMPPAVPFALETTLVISYSGVLLVVALLGTLLSLWRIAKIDPLIAIGRAD